MSKNITESISEYQFEEKQALEGNDSGTDEFDSSSDDRAAFFVGREPPDLEGRSNYPTNCYHKFSSKFCIDQS